MASSYRDWAGLPEHTLDLILTKFGSLSDYFCFTAVCTRYRSNVVNLNPSMNIFFNILKASRIKVPMLMVKTEENNEDNRGLYNAFNGITYKIQFPLSYYYRIIGSSHGWLLCVDENLVITPLDPFNNGCISLPIFQDASQLFGKQWREDRFDYYINKAILTSDRHLNPNSYEVVVIYGGRLKLAHYKSGQDCWNFINLVPEKNYTSADIIYYEGCNYSATYCSEVLQLDSHNGTAKTIVPASERGADGLYLVESQDGELLLVKRFWHVFDRNTDETYFDKTFKFKVFKLVHLNGKEFAIWEELDNIGEQALFVGGGNHSVSVSTINWPKFKPNSIYYTAHDYFDVVRYIYEGADEDTGIFNLEDESFHSHQVLGPSEKDIQPPIWFVPNLK